MSSYDQDSAYNEKCLELRRAEQESDRILDAIESDIDHQKGIEHAASGADVQFTADEYRYAKELVRVPQYGMKDSGERQAFQTGAVRDASDGKPRLDLISPFMEERLGLWLAMGAEKYEPRNWERGIPYTRCLASLKRHVMRFEMGLRDEDHLAAIVCNAMFIIHYEEMLKRGLLPAELDDRPNYGGGK